MLISDYAEVGVVPHNQKYYLDLGYDIPLNKNNSISQGTKILVKICDLTKGSSAKVKVKCDDCGKEYVITWKHYLRWVHDDGTIFCNDCAHAKLSRENNPNWRYDKTDEERLNDRSTKEYRDWSKSVLSRDKYICQYCEESKGGHMNAHHLNGYNWDKDNRFNTDNGVCLCEDCHEKFHSIYGKGNNTKEQFLEWIGDIKYENKKNF